jgi:hypothetical protein
MMPERCAYAGRICAPSINSAKRRGYTSGEPSGGLGCSSDQIVAAHQRLEDDPLPVDKRFPPSVSRKPAGYRCPIASLVCLGSLQGHESRSQGARILVLAATLNAVVGLASFLTFGRRWFLA